MLAQGGDIEQANIWHSKGKVALATSLKLQLFVGNLFPADNVMAAAMRCQGGCCILMEVALRLFDKVCIPPILIQFIPLYFTACCCTFYFSPFFTENYYLIFAHNDLTCPRNTALQYLPHTTLYPTPFLQNADLGHRSNLCSQSALTKIGNPFVMKLREIAYRSVFL